MQKILFLGLSLLLFACAKESTNEPNNPNNTAAILTGEWHVNTEAGYNPKLLCYVVDGKVRDYMEPVFTESPATFSGDVTFEYQRGSWVRRYTLQPDSVKPLYGGGWGYRGTMDEIADGVVKFSYTVYAKKFK